MTKNGLQLEVFEFLLHLKSWTNFAVLKKKLQLEEGKQNNNSLSLGR